jgi:hypothetical protein
MFTKFASQVGLNFLEVQRCQTNSWTSINPWLVPNDLTPQWLGEATNRLSKIALEEVDNRRREVQLIRTLEDIGLRQ